MSAKTMKKILPPIIIILLITMLGCYYIIKEYSKNEHIDANLPGMNDETVTEEPVVSTEDLRYECEAILLEINKDEGKIAVKRTDDGKSFWLKYDGTTDIFGKHGNSLSLDQLLVGEVLDISFTSHSNLLKSMQISSDVWTMSDVSEFLIGENGRTMTIGSDIYRITDDTIISGGDSIAKLMDITDVDTITVKGKDRNLYSVIIEQGHGYVRLQNDAYFVGGWIEIGQRIIKKVSADMLIPVPEGNYHVRLTNKGYAGEEDIVVTRDEETVIDLSKIEIEEVAIGHVEFDIEPDFAQLFVDGEITEYEDRVPLEYGIHSIHVELAGYVSVDTNIRVSSEYADVEISLEPDSESTDKGKTSSSASSSATPTQAPTAAPDAVSTPTLTPIPTLADAVTPIPTSSAVIDSSAPTVVVSADNKMYIESPKDAAVYIDGVYIGIVPASTMKITGNHTITLSRDGYKTRSYSVSIGDDGKDVTFSFSDLLTE